TGQGVVGPVAVVGWGWRTALGEDVDAVTARLVAGDRAGVANPVTRSRCRMLAPVPRAPRPGPHARYVHRMGLLAIEVAIELMAASGRAAGPRFGLFSAVGGLR